MRPTRRTQPHRRGQQTPGPALTAMKAGKPAFLRNPMDTARATARSRRRRKGALRRLTGR